MAKYHKYIKVTYQNNHAVCSHDIKMIPYMIIMKYTNFDQ